MTDDLFTDADDPADDLAAMQQRLWDLRARVALYPPLRPISAVPRPIATDRDIEELRVAQLGVIAAALRYLAARRLSAGSVRAEQARVRLLSTEEYREYLAVRA